MDPSLLENLPPHLQDAFFEVIANSVNVAQTDAQLEIPSEGDLDVKILDLEILPFDEHMTEGELENLSQNLQAITYETMIDLLGSLKRERQLH